MSRRMAGSRPAQSAARRRVDDDPPSLDVDLRDDRRTNGTSTRCPSVSRSTSRSWAPPDSSPVTSSEHPASRVDAASPTSSSSYQASSDSPLVGRLSPRQHDRRRRTVWCHAEHSAPVRSGISSNPRARCPGGRGRGHREVAGHPRTRRGGRVQTRTVANHLGIVGVQLHRDLAPQAVWLADAGDDELCVHAPILPDRAQDAVRRRGGSGAAGRALRCRRPRRRPGSSSRPSRRRRRRWGHGAPRPARRSSSGCGSSRSACRDRTRRRSRSRRDRSGR